MMDFDERARLAIDEAVHNGTHIDGIVFLQAAIVQALEDVAAMVRVETASRIDHPEALKSRVGWDAVLVDVMCPCPESSLWPPIDREETP